MFVNPTHALQVTLRTFSVVKHMLKAAETKYVKRIDLCPNDCIAYWDSEYLPEPYKHAHRTLCPVCGVPRYVVDPVGGALRAAKCMYLFPMHAYVRSLYARPDLVPFLYHDADGHPEGHVTRSRGFQSKVRDNPEMNKDHRNLGFVGASDGVPFFDDQKRGAWPFVLRCANLPDALSTRMSNCHMHLLSANEYWEVDKAAGVLRRRIRAPKSLMPHMTVIVDDLLRNYKGVCGVFLT